MDDTHGGPRRLEADEVKARVDIVEFIGEDVPLRQSGAGFVGLCPFHSERTPSFSVSSDRQAYHCFGCQEGGDVISYVMRRDGVDFLEALGRVAERVGSGAYLRLPGEAGSQGAVVVDRRVSDAIARAYAVLQEQYPGSAGERYMRDVRGLGRVEGFGYVPNAWGWRFPAGLDLEVLCRIGLAYPDGRPTGYWRDRVVMPYTWVAEPATPGADPEVLYTTLYGRICFRPQHVNEDGRTEPNHYYTTSHLLADGERRREVWQGPMREDLQSVDRWFRGLFMPEHAKLDEFRVVEAALDALSAMVLGLGPTVALGGTDNFSLLRPGCISPTATVVWALDNDGKWALRPRPRDGAGRTIDTVTDLSSLGKSTWDRFYAHLGSRLKVQLPPRVSSPEGTATKDWNALLTAHLVGGWLPTVQIGEVLPATRIRLENLADIDQPALAAINPTKTPPAGTPSEPASLEPERSPQDAGTRTSQRLVADPTVDDDAAAAALLAMLRPPGGMPGEPRAGLDPQGATTRLPRLS